MLRKFGFFASVIFVVTACAGGSGGTIDGRAIEQEITGFVQAELSGAVVAKATCPESQKIRVGDVFECVLLIDSQEVHFAVTQTDSGYDYALAAGVLTQRLSDYENKAADFVLATESVDVAVDCKGPNTRTWLFVTGATTIDCVIDYGDLKREIRIDIAATAEVNGLEFTQARLELSAILEMASEQLNAEIGNFVLECKSTFDADDVTLVFDVGATFTCVAGRDFKDIAEISIEVLSPTGEIKATVI